MTILMVAFFGYWFCIIFHLFSKLVHLLLKGLILVQALGSQVDRSLLIG